MNEPSLEEQFACEINLSLKELMSKMHLYQSLKVSDKFFDESEKSWNKSASSPLRLIRGSSAPSCNFGLLKAAILAQPWVVKEIYFAPLRVNLHNLSLDSFQFFHAPTIMTTCTRCKNSGAFNPLEASIESVATSLDRQIFFFIYQCQACKGEPIRFLIKREGLKLTLVGREPFEKPDVPSFLPTTLADYFRNAIIAHNAGQTLAGICLLRIFIEQFWKSSQKVIEAINGKIRATGDELGAAYNETLPSDFKNRFPSLTQIYSEMSKAMHEADANSEAFEKCKNDVLKHFDARRIYEI